MAVKPPAASPTNVFLFICPSFTGSPGAAGCRGASPLYALTVDKCGRGVPIWIGQDLGGDSCQVAKKWMVFANSSEASTMGVRLYDQFKGEGQSMGVRESDASGPLVEPLT